ncbi:MAG TPA: oligosaccharide flippase family protein [Candidatus Ligilactobacillus excrementigallinarum]|uniref:Oligosaccharide flippase family protein n=1 Tax=Candidatus Ligilactobacillus excrementigallinarum TaxID=2838641 RepID=A0A9D1UXY7_9LACO|nr:oligosaccharide flippase family protein [Candidatus Ligilactobacillus excrementigallinarum]
MNKKSRLYNSVKNSFAGSFTQLIIIILGFISQTIFIKTLGATYLGIKGLFTNILSVLSFTDLGIGTAFTFSFYKPLAENDEKTIAQIMRLFKKVYEGIGIIIGIIGIAIIPFIHYFTHIHIKYLYVYYLLFLLNTVLSYFFTYKRTILDADQLSYINLFNQTLFKLIQVIAQCLVLIVYKSFIGFLLIQIITNLASNILISIEVDKKYPFINNKKFIKEKLPSTKLLEIMKHAMGTIGQKIGTIIVNNTDNMLISYFIGLSVVGIYSNYILITSSLSGILNKAFQSIASSVGNLSIEKNENLDYQFEVFEKSIYIVLFCVFICSTCLMTLVNPFIKLWAGPNYRMPIFTVVLLVINFTITGFRAVFQTFITAYGLYVKDGKKAVVEAILNFVFSIAYIKLFNMGVSGVILGTITSNILANWYEPYIVLKYGIKIQSRIKKIIIKLVSYLIIICISMLSEYILINKYFAINNFIDLILISILTLFVSLVLFVLIFGWNKNFRFIISLVKRIVKK